MKKIAIALTALLIVVGLSSAGGKKEEAAAPAKPAMLTVLWFDDANESAVFADTMSDYTKSGKAQIDLQVIPFKDYEQKLKMMIAGGTAPDLARVTNNHVAALLDSLLVLDGKLQGLEDMKKQFLPGALAFATNGAGKTVALPTEATANGMLVNRTYFKNAGIDLDALSKTWTWKDWEDAMKKVLAANEKCKYGLAVDFTPHRFSTILFQFGGRFLKPDLSGMGFNTPETRECLDFFKRLHDTNLSPKSVWLGSEKPQELFMAGLAACHIGGSWWINAYAKDVKGFEWGAVQMPKGKIRSSVPGGKFIASFKGGKNEAAAVDVIRVFSDRDHNAKYCKDTFNLSSRIDANIQYPSNNADFAVFMEELKATPAFTADEWKNPAFNKVSTFIREQIVEVLQGKATSAQAAEKVDAQGNTYFK